MSNDNDDEAVGYGRPPKKHRFKPGQSGNPRGRRKGREAISFANLLGDSLAETVTITLNNKIMKITKAHAGMMQLANRFAKGEWGALKLLLNSPQLLAPINDGQYPSNEDARVKLAELIQRVVDAQDE